MPDTGVFATTLEVQRKAGANASSVSNVEGYINQYMTEVEAEINVLSGKNWTTAYGGLDVSVKGLLKQAASNLAAMYVINYDMSGFTSRSEAQTMLDVLRDGFNRAMALLKEQNEVTFMENA